MNIRILHHERKGVFVSCPVSFEAGRRALGSFECTAAMTTTAAAVAAASHAVVQP